MNDSILVRVGALFMLSLPIVATEIDTCSEGTLSCNPMRKASLLQRSSGSSGRLGQVLVLTLNSAEGKDRFAKLKSKLGPPLPSIESIVGLDFHSFQNEDEMMRVQPFALPDRARQEWLQHDEITGVPRVAAKDSSLALRPPTGALGCAMGHRHMWTRAANLAGTERAWSLILEDDARPVQDLGDASFLSNLLLVPEDVDLVFLDGHCTDFKNTVPTLGGSVVSGNQTNLYARWSSAYAVTPQGAAALLKVPFKYNSDHLLNAAVKCYGLKAFCPSRPLFENVYPHESLIHPAQAETNLISAIQTEDLTCEALLMT
eukprot:TRINITY_DN3592_c0_g3_i1.p1 TRINITY_DN3592_c0_g3~~TRINITY_DN3592_c0_g3_i1.p1  ORF type:complete len:334 (-),score=45.16 TRINITY_DN3592_c0_g3_i1:76-1023(-)